MKPNDDEFADYVEHPRFGRLPRYTGLNPQTDYRGTHIHWHSPIDCRIPNTAIVANTSRQKAPTVAVTHYYDVMRRCRDCKRMFLFFAEEQRYWYEELGFGLDSDCVRCVDCRKVEQDTAGLRVKYELLFHRENRSHEETLELIDCGLTLIERSIFGHQSLDRIRCWLKSIPPASNLRHQATFQDLTTRAKGLKKSAEE